jgi:lysine-N-methylase
VRQTRIIQPNYADRFRCLGSDCEDTCCSGWQVSVSEHDYQRITTVPDGPLRSLIDTSIVRNDPGTVDPEMPFARVQMLDSGECPLLSADRLCRVQLECGESYLCHICAVYPRNSYCVDGLTETELSLSCPEAARLILLSPTLVPADRAPGHQLSWDETAANGTDLRPYFWQIRELVVRLILNRNYPLWQRLFLVGTFCRRLESFTRGETNRRLVDLLDDFSRAVATQGLGESMDRIHADLPLQFEVVLSLVAQRINGRSVSPRVREVLELFAQGLGHTRTASIDGQVSRYAEAYQRDFTPFFRRHPRMLENLLVNAVFRDAFPFGKALTPAGGHPQPVKEFAMLAIQFALIKGLLIGIAGARGRRLSSADAVKAVQIASRLFEHNPRFLRDAYAALERRGLTDARGLTMLLRN